MATELGKAYVQIMPSAKGISGNIQKTLNPEATEAGKSAGKRMATAISNSLSSVGSTLTKAITVPALGAATAIGGIVSALGWGRLTGLDAARAKLQGLGYDMQSVDRISEQVRDTIQGTVITMAEGTSVAAGALAAGVKEGEELQRYIKLVGDAAVGANRPINDMAMIFNRVQGMGRLMTQELNMIEDGMPGFAMAMADSLGVTQEEFRKMVTDGKVSSKQFLDVMEDFAGSMSDAYANSWAGMVANTKSNIGIIGESLLGGVFEQSKESIAEFLEFLRSDDLRSWASETGQVIGQAFSSMIEFIKSAIQWWSNLDGETQKLIMTIGGLAVALGPILTIVSKIITFMSPVRLVIAAIVGLISVIAGLYNTNEEFRSKVNEIWSSISEAITTAISFVSEFVMEIFGGLVSWWKENNEMIIQATQNFSKIISPIFSFLMPFLKSLVTSTWNAIKGAIQGAITVITGIIQFFAALFTGNWSALWESVKQIGRGAVQFIVNFIQVSLVGRALRLGRSLLSGFVNIIRNLWSRVTSLFRNGISGAYNAVTGFFGKFRDAGKRIVTSIADGIKGAISKVTDAIGNVTQKVRDFLPFSPPKEGPLLDIMDVKWGETISAGILKGEGEIAKAMERALDFDLTKKATFNVNSNQAPHLTTQQQQQPIIMQIDGKTFAKITGDYTAAEGGNRIRRIERGLAT